MQLDPLKTILVFSHNHNTFDKRKLLEQGENEFFKVSPKSVDLFIRNPNEQHIKKFFMVDIDPLLEKYSPGDPSMKPDVLAQIKEIEATRSKMNEQMQKDAMTNVMFSEDGKEPRPLSCNDIVHIIQTQKQQLQMMGGRIKELEEIVRLQKQQLNKTHSSKSTPEIEL